MPPLDLLVRVFEPGQPRVDDAELMEIFDGSVFPKEAHPLLIDAVDTIFVGVEPDYPLTPTPDAVALRQKGKGPERYHLVTQDALHTFDSPVALLDAIAGG